MQNENKIDKNDLFKLLPKVDELIELTKNFPEFANFSDEFRTKIIRETLDNKRQKIASGAITQPFDRDEVLEDIKTYFKNKMRKPIRRSVNAAGIILHTNQGRAVIPEAAKEAILDVLGYSTLEIVQETGKRGNRLDNLEPLLCELTGAEGAVVVNNNAAATLLILAVLADLGEEVIVARGQLVEIGGSFRLPDVMQQAGVKLKEIGTTNRVHFKDYKNAISEKTAAIMKVHPSNYKIIGFTKEVPIEELAALGKEHNIPVVDDLGAGAYADISRFGYPKEPLVADSIAAGADIVCSSGDKLLGGVQAGVIVGRKFWTDKIRAHPLYRALRCDKITLAALHATLQLFLDPQTLPEKNPTWRMIAMTQEQALKIATDFAKRITVISNKIKAEVIKGFSELGSGSLPGAQIPTALVAIENSDMNAEQLAKALRMNEPPIFTRIENELVLVDVRTLQTGDAEIIAEAIKNILK